MYTTIEYDCIKLTCNCMYTCKSPLTWSGSVDCSLIFPFKTGSPSGNNINVSRLITVFPLKPFPFNWEKYPGLPFCATDCSLECGSKSSCCCGDAGKNSFSELPLMLKLIRVEFRKFSMFCLPYWKILKKKVW